MGLQPPSQLRGAWGVIHLSLAPLFPSFIHLFIHLSSTESCLCAWHHSRFGDLARKKSRHVPSRSIQSNGGNKWHGYHLKQQGSFE